LRKPLMVVVAGLCVLGLTAGVAQAELTQTAEIKLTSKKADSSTGTSSTLTASESDPSVLQPLAASNVVVNFPSGTKFDYTVPPVCTDAQAQQIQSTDGAICSRALVGTGTAKANVKPLLNEDVSLSIKAFNGKNKLYFYLVPEGGVGNPLLLTGTLKGSKLTTPVPRIEAVGGSGVFAVLTQFVLNTKKITKSGKNYATTPKSCSGKWTTKTAFTYVDGSSKSVTSTQPCSK
jgi:hypothetical protein